MHCSYRPCEDDIWHNLPAQMAVDMARCELVEPQLVRQTFFSLQGPTTGLTSRQGWYNVMIEARQDHTNTRFDTTPLRIQHSDARPRIVARFFKAIYNPDPRSNLVKLKPGTLLPASDGPTHTACCCSYQELSRARALLV